VRVKIDENLSWEVAEDLRAAGHDADTVHDEGLVGGVDPTVLARAKADHRVLVTLDKGIADVRAYPPDQYAGIVLLRPPSTGRLALRAFARSHLPGVLIGDLTGRLVVVTEGSIRIR
jgi:predicted nuclease of predicted toxin-antitoxin system